jgi:signal peptide peptidase SppA
VDSPGGVTDLVPETAAEIRAARERKPITAVANTMAASAAYWLASQASEVVVTPSGWLGSIGVYMLHVDWSGNNAQIGVKPTYISAGKYKTEGNPEEPLSESAREHMQEDVDRFYSMFLSDVALGRGVDVETVRADFGEGRVLLAEPSLQAGMADRVETFEDAVARLQATPPRSGAPVGALNLNAEAIHRMLTEAGYSLPRAEVPEPQPDPIPAPEPEPVPEPDPSPDAEPEAGPEADAEPDTTEPPEPPADEPEPEQPAALSVLDALTA